VDALAHGTSSYTCANLAGKQSIIAGIIRQNADNLTVLNLQTKRTPRSAVNHAGVPNRLFSFGMSFGCYRLIRGADTGLT
jgi:hypothetical protein